MGKDKKGMNDDQFSLEEEEGKEQQEDRKTPTKDVSEDHLKAILERIGEMEKQQQQQTKVSDGHLKAILERIGELEKQQQQQTKEVNGDAISLENDGQFDGNSETITDQQQQLKKFHEKFAKLETELKMAKLELENKALEQKLKHQELVGEQKALKEKVIKIEQKNDFKIKMSSFTTSSSADEFSPLQLSEDHLKAILERIGELEKQQQQQTKATAGQLSKILEKIGEMEKQNENTDKGILEQFSKMENDQKKILEKISEMEKQTQKKVFFKFQENCWDAFACHEDIQISGDKSLIVHYKGNTYGWRSVFAKYPIVLNKHLSDFFYFEISVQKKHTFWGIFGFAVVKQQTKLDELIRYEKGTYAYDNYGDIWINGEEKGPNAQYSYGDGDTVGIGVNSATRQIIFTKNGLRLDFSGLFVDPSFADGSLYPFVSLLGPGGKIEANFGPNFKFDLATL